MARSTQMNRGAMVSLNHGSLSFLILLLSLALSACSKGPAEPAAAPEPRIPQVQTLTLEPRTWNQTLDAYGVVEPTEDVAITVDFSAQVAAVHFEEGQRVEEGQLLIELDARKRGLRSG